MRPAVWRATALGCVLVARVWAAGLFGHRTTRGALLAALHAAVWFVLAAAAWMRSAKGAGAVRRSDRLATSAGLFYLAFLGLTLARSEESAE